jgi:hypothetical protein
MLATDGSTQTGNTLALHFDKLSTGDKLRERPRSERLIRLRYARGVDIL